MITIPRPPSEPPDLALQRAENIILATEAVIGTLVQAYLSTYFDFWFARGLQGEYPEQPSPEEILVKWGPSAGYLLGVQEKSRIFIASIASDLGVEITDYIPSDFLSPQVPLVLHEDGTVTLQD